MLRGKFQQHWSAIAEREVARLVRQRHRQPVALDGAFAGPGPHGFDHLVRMIECDEVATFGPRQGVEFRGYAKNDDAWPGKFFNPWENEFLITALVFRIRPQGRTKLGPDIAD